MINTGRGNDLIFAGNGDDFVDGGVGNDTAFTGQGNDTFQWDPGDGNDVIDGGEGHADTMLFNGGAGADTASLSPNGHAAVFLRQPANIRMDLDNVEQVQYNALGGTDTTTVDDMSGTDVRQVNVNVGANGADSVLDNVIVNGSDQADHVKVSGEASTVKVDGSQAETTISGADTSDQLHINTGDGNDKVTVDGTATSLIGVTADLGADQH
jgi:Ca2+-binding RTX toxin-like protein